MQADLFELSITPDSVRNALLPRCGGANGITARDLVRELTGSENPKAERRLRQVIEQLRNEGEPICAHPGDGYHWASSHNDLDETCEFLYSRAMTSLRQVAAMRRVAMPDLRGQLRMPLEAPENPPSTEPREVFP